MNLKLFMHTDRTLDSRQLQLKLVQNNKVNYGQVNGYGY